MGLYIMETAFNNIDIREYLKSKRAHTEEKELLEGKRYVNQRQEVVQQFVDQINQERKGTKYKQVTWPQINGQLRHFKYMSDLKRFYNECNNGNCFSSLFWWKLKQK